MPGLSFANKQRQPRNGGDGVGLWFIPIILIVVSVVLITVSVRMGSSGPLAAVRGGIQSVTVPIANACNVISTPFKSIGTSVTTSAYSDDDIARIQQENEQLTVLVSQLEEYRQQSQRLTTLMKLSDTYGLETISATVTTQTAGWDQVSVINVGTNDGVQVGMGVLSSSGLYGQIESTTPTTSVIRLISDATSSVSAMLQGSRAKGVLKGSYDGALTLNYISLDQTVGEGDVVITSGEGGSYPKGILIGKVKSVDLNANNLYYDVVVTPISSFQSCEEVLVLTGNESEVANLVDSDLLASIIQGKTDTAAAAATDAAATDAAVAGSASTTDSKTTTQNSAASSSTSGTKSTSSSTTSDSKTDAAKTDANATGGQ